MSNSPALKAPTGHFKPLAEFEQTVCVALGDAGIGTEDAVAVAISGGRDSVVLAHAMRGLAQRGMIRSVVLLHVDHQLRGEESDMDREFVEALASEWNVPLSIAQLGRDRFSDLQAGSSEDSARRARYTALSRLAEEHDITWIATAHHATDQAETVLLRMMRGAGPLGLSGIPRVRILGEAALVRPMLGVFPETIERYAEAHHLQYRTDSSNADIRFRRNLIRTRLLPAIDHEQRIVSLLVRFADGMRKQSEYFERRANFLFVDRTTLLRNEYRAAPMPVQFAAFARLRTSSGMRGMPTRAEFERVNEFLTGGHKQNHRSSVYERSCSMQLREGYALNVTETTIRIEPVRSVANFAARQLRMNDEVVTNHGRLSMAIATNDRDMSSPDTVLFDSSVVETSLLLVRPWRSGDRMQPFGMHATKLVADLLGEAGIHGRAKLGYPVVVHETSGEILWVPAIRRSAAFPIVETTREPLELRFELSFSEPCLHPVSETGKRIAELPHRPTPN